MEHAWITTLLEQLYHLLRLWNVFFELLETKTSMTNQWTLFQFTFFVND